MECYVYNLSIDSLVFYIGISINPARRYLQHFTDTQSRVYKIARYCLFRGVICNMSLLECCTYYEAEAREHEYIKAYSKQYFLLNNERLKGEFSEPIPHVYMNGIGLMIYEEINIIKQQAKTLFEQWETSKLITTG